MTELAAASPPASKAEPRVKRFFALLVPTLEEIGEHRPIWPPVAVGWVLALAAAVAMRPLMQGAVAGQPPAAGTAVDVLLLLAVVLGPVFMFLRAGLATGLIWSVLVLANAPQRVRLLLSVTLYAEAIILFHGVAAAVFFQLASGGSVFSPEQLQAPWSLGAYLPMTRLVLWSVAQQVTAFHLAAIAFVAFALRRTAGLGWPLAAGAAVLAWAAALGFAAIRVMVTS